ncbi:unnamed protein product [Nezara viridula]|uniref:G domain-containing protein n=1 Tax=Nezara viridula TaxID=85310 RepID=A0A9P0H1J2_NEZVI|nr:unnamed protein product [Nezara viridula]
MGKIARAVICGYKGVGKTAILEQVIYGNLTKETFLQTTIEDIYIASIETDKGTKEKIRIYDTETLLANDGDKTSKCSKRLSDTLVIFLKNHKQGKLILININKRCDKFFIRDSLATN